MSVGKKKFWIQSKVTNIRFDRENSILPVNRKKRKILSDILGRKGEADVPVLQRDILGDFLVSKLSFLFVFEAACLYFLLTQVMILSLLKSMMGVKTR